MKMMIGANSADTRLMQAMAFRPPTRFGAALMAPHSWMDSGGAIGTDGGATDPKDEA
jgi:hypothetical protein